MHLESEQPAPFAKGNARERAAVPPDTLPSYFELCRIDLFAKTLLYSEISKYYMWNTSTKSSNYVSKGNLLKDGQIYIPLMSQNAESFYLRMLLINVREPT